MKIEEQRAAMRARLEAALGARLGFTLDEASGLTGIAKKSFYNLSVGYKVMGKRRVGIDDLLDLVAPLKPAQTQAMRLGQPPAPQRGAPTKLESLEAKRLGLSVKEYRAQQALELGEGGAA
ncbi:MAG: hypothetical protein ABIK08_15130 [Pseudomonadota bacterium]